MKNAGKRKMRENNFAALRALGRRALGNKTLGTAGRAGGLVGGTAEMAGAKWSVVRKWSAERAEMVAGGG